MLFYQYRWLVASLAMISIFVVGFFYDIAPILKQLHSQIAIGKEQRQQLIVLKRLASSVVAKQNMSLDQMNNTLPKNEAEVLHELLQLLHLYDLSLREITVLPPPSADVLSVHLLITGNFQQLAALMFALTEQHQQMLVLDFSYKTNEKLSVLNADMMIYKKNNLSMPKPAEKFLLEHNPFCGENQVEQTNEVEKALHVPLQQIKMVGMVRQNKRREAWVMLPNKTLINIQVDSLLGSERAKVVDIQQDYILFMMPDRSQHVLRM